MSAAIGFGSARAIASIYAELAAGGTRLGITADTRVAMATQPRPPTAGTFDLVLHTDTRYSLGWWRPFPGFAFGSDVAFGTPGGSFGFGDRVSGIGYGYVTNRMGYHVWDDPRDLAFRRALAACLRETG